MQSTIPLVFFVFFLLSVENIATTKTEDKSIANVALYLLFVINTTHLLSCPTILSDYSTNM